jgi:hypothetical protein
MAAKRAKIDFDPYEVIGVPYDADEKAIVSGYRKAALKWHPDKNPDKKEYGLFLIFDFISLLLFTAEKMFIKLSSALELLTDTAARVCFAILLNGVYLYICLGCLRSSAFGEGRNSTTTRKVGCETKEVKRRIGGARSKCYCCEEGRRAGGTTKTR